MAIDQTPIPYPDTQSLAHAQKRFYPVKIPVSHWQLRHYISTSSTSLYYASGKEVFHLDTTTHRRTHLASLPFDARCTASAHGWLCVGGEDDGHFAAIQLPTSPHRSPTVKIERIGEEIVNSVSIHRLQDEKAHLDDIVAILTNNDQTVRIYSLPMGQETRVKDLPFAINHATLSPDGKMLVAVGDLNQAYFFTREILDKAPQIPKPHNRLGAKDVDWRLTNVVSLHVSESTVGYFTTAWSPSGGLVAVGSEGGYITVLDRELLERRDVEDDEAIVAVVAGSRADVPSPYPGAIRSMVFSPEPWDLLCWAEDQGRVCIGDLRTGLKSRQVIHLEPESDELERLAVEDVGEQEGIDGENGVAPQRLDELEERIMRRYGSDVGAVVGQQVISSVNFANEYIETRRRQRAARQELAMRQEQRDTLRGMLDGDAQGLTTREHQILETLRTSRQREEARASQGGVASNVTYTTPDLFGSTAPRSTRQSSATNGTSSSTATTDLRSHREILTTMQESLSTISRIYSTATSNLRQTPPAGSSTSSSSSSSSRLPRIRQSAFQSNPAEGSQTLEEGEGNDHDGDEEEGNLWRSIEEHMMESAGESGSGSAGRGPLFEGVPGRGESPGMGDMEGSRAREEARLRERWRPSESTRTTTTTTVLGGTQSSAEGNSSTRRGVETAEQRANRLRGDTIGERYEALFRATGSRMMMGGGSGGGGIGAGLGREGGVRTAGLAISEDGGRLWVATERGIFEVKVGLRGRMGWGSLELR